MNTITKIPAAFTSTLPADHNIHPSEPIDAAAWIWHPDCAVDEATFACFRKSFESDGSPLVIHVTADMRYRLFVDGESLAMGPDRSDVEHWTYNSYEIPLEAGEHEIRAEVWWLGNAAPQALITFRGGFCLKADGNYDEQLTTGTAEWQVLRRKGWDLKRESPPYCYHDIGNRQYLDAAVWFRETEWVRAVVARPAVKNNMTGVDQVGGWKCFPSPLPEQFRRTIQVGSIRALVDNPVSAPEHVQVSAAACEHDLLADFNAAYQAGEHIDIPANTSIGILIDLEDYYCGYPSLKISDGKNADICF